MKEGNEPMALSVNVQPIRIGNKLREWVTVHEAVINVISIL